MTGSTLTDAPTLFGSLGESATRYGSPGEEATRYGSPGEGATLYESVGEGATLDDLLVALWEGLTADRTVVCPVCEGEMRPAYSAHARAIGGKCTTCGSTMS